MFVIILDGGQWKILFHGVFTAIIVDYVGFQSISTWKRHTL